MLCVCSCSPKEGAMDDLKDFAKELSEDGADYTAEEWEKAADKFAKIEEELNKYDYTDEELKEIGRQKAKCGRAFMEYAAKSAAKQIHSYTKQIEGAAEELGSMADGFGAELGGALEEALGGDDDKEE